MPFKKEVHQTWGTKQSNCICALALGKHGSEVQRGAHELTNPLDKSSGLLLVPRPPPEFFLSLLC